jgi:Predicted integral membrane protein (DUF2269)
MTWYLLLKYIHVLLAITAVGTNVTYAVWNIRGAQEKEHLSFALRGVSFLDRRVANPAYGLLLVTGLGLVWVGGWGFTRWIISALFLFVLLIVVAAGFYSRTMNRQVEVLDKEGASSPAYLRLAAQAQRVGIILIVIALAIVFVMVVKPAS